MAITRIGKEDGLVDASIRVGHKSIRTTQRYFHYKINDLMKDKYEGKLRKGVTNNSGKKNI